MVKMRSYSLEAESGTWKVPGLGIFRKELPDPH